MHFRMFLLYTQFLREIKSINNELNHEKANVVNRKGDEKKSESRSRRIQPSPMIRRFDQDVPAGI